MDETVFDLEEVQQQAIKELQLERFREAVETHKAVLRIAKPFWHKIFPFKITITRR
jgi:hypothetical protein